MNIDVLITSCARPDVLKKTVQSFQKMIVTEHELRYVLVEDKVDDVKRQEEGRKWVEKNKGLFDDIVFHEKKAGKGYWWQEIIKICNTKYHIHLEDDNEFITKVNIDPVIKMMQNQENIIEVIFSRGKPDKRTKPKILKIDGIKLTEMQSMSIASGIYNTPMCRKILSVVGWETMVHEAGNLTPTSKKLGYRKFVLGHGKKHYEHIGAKLGYNKGKWKK
jgi:hypothetical protein